MEETHTLVNSMARGAVAEARAVLGQEERTLSPEEALELFEASEILIDMLDRAHDAYFRFMSGGAPGVVARARLLALIGTAEDALWMIGTAEKGVTDAGKVLTGVTRRLRMLSRHRTKAVKLRAGYGALLAWMESAPPAFEPAILERASKGPFVSIDKVLASIREGKEL